MAEQTVNTVVYPANAYWFETRADRKLAKHWPSKGKKRAMQSANMDNMNGVITVTDYGRYYDRLKTPDKVYPMLSSVDANRTHFFKTLDKDFADYLALATNGYTSNRMLGKEMDKQLNNLIIREVTHANERQVNDSDSDKAWADLAASDPITTPADYIKMLSAERILNDPKLMTSFKTADELKALGFTIPEGAEPVRYTDEGMALYDVTSVYRRNPIKGVDEAAPSYAIGKDGEINLSKLTGKFTSDDVAALASELSKRLGIKLQPVDVKVGTWSNISISRARNYGRRIMNYIYKHTGRRPRAMPAGKLFYSQNGTAAEQAYTMAKAIGNHMVQNAILNTERLIANNPGIENLPDAETFAKHKTALENAAQCLIASQLVSMTGMKDDQAQILAEMFKVEAAQSIARLPNLKENKWAMPLISSYMANGAQLLAGEMRVYGPEARANYINKLGVRNTDVELMNAIMYGKRDFSKAHPQLFGEMYPTANLYDNPINKPDLSKTDEEGDEPIVPIEEKKKIERKWWEIERTYDAMLSSKPKYLDALRTSAKELMKEAISEINYPSKHFIKLYRDRLVGDLDKYCVPGGMECISKDIELAEKRLEKDHSLGNEKEVETLKLSKEVLEDTLDFVEQGLKLGSGEKVELNLAGVDVELPTYSREETVKFTGSTLFNNMTKAKIKIADDKKTTTFKTVIKKTLQEELKPLIQKLTGDTRVAKEESKTM